VLSFDQSAAMPTGVACQLKQSVAPMGGSSSESSSRALIGMGDVALVTSFGISTSRCNQLRDFVT